MLDSSFQTEPVAANGGARRGGRVILRVAGYAFVLALMFLSPLAMFVPAALLNCGLRYGRRAAWLALALGAAAATALVMLPAPGASAPPAEVVKMSYGYLSALILAVGVPSVLTLPLVERGERFGRVLMFAVLASLPGLAVTEIGMRLVANFSPYGDQLVRAQELVARVVEGYQKAGIPADAVTALRRWMDVGLYCLPSVFVVDVIVIFVLSVVMVGRLRARREFLQTRNVSATPYLFRNLALPEWLLFAFVIGGLTPLASGIWRHIGANVLAVVIFLYLLQGLAIFRSLLASLGAGFMGVLFAYAMLAFLTLTGIAPLLLSIAGLFDSFFDFRHFNRKDDSHESHID